jgi:hypothetical protein
VEPEPRRLGLGRPNPAATSGSTRCSAHRRAKVVDRTRHSRRRAARNVSAGRRTAGRRTSARNVSAGRRTSGRNVSAGQRTPFRNVSARLRTSGVRPARQRADRGDIPRSRRRPFVLLHGVHEAVATVADCFTDALSDVTGLECRVDTSAAIWPSGGCPPGGWFPGAGIPVVRGLGYPASGDPILRGPEVVVRK